MSEPPKIDSAPASTNITFDGYEFQELEEVLRREWIVTNGIGGYASASISGANTRRYHGLLVAALDAPVGRAVLLSKLEEVLTVQLSENEPVISHALSTNLYPDTVYPEGYKHIVNWKLLPSPAWVWDVGSGIKIEKQIWMEHGQNSTRIVYRLLQAPAGAKIRLQLTPLVAWKDYHSEMHHRDETPAINWDSQTSTLRLLAPSVPGIKSGVQPIDISMSGENGEQLADLSFEENLEWYYRFQHPREQERGLDYEEDLFSPGVISIPIRIGVAVCMLASAGEENSKSSANESWNNLQSRKNDLIKSTAMHDDFGKLLALAADQFIVEIPGKRTTIIAGYHWFADWGRDTMIALPGLCLSTGRPEIAREILLSFSESVDQGMLPNRFPDSGEKPEYNTVDATLWYFVAIYRYTLQTGDRDTLKEKLWTVLKDIVKWHQAGTRYNIYEDSSDGLIYAGEPGKQLTWMDAKVGDWVVTPRIGKPVEINALWYNALSIMSYFANLLELPDETLNYSKLAERTRKSFLSKFARPDGKGLFDLVDSPDANDGGCIRPNQIFALSLPFAPVASDDPLAQQILSTIHSELWTFFGLRTLSPHDPSYKSRYEGDQWHRDGAYHEGTVWPWLLGPYVEAHFRVFADKAHGLAVLQPLQEHLTEYGIGSIAEILDGDVPQRPDGCIAQAWSVAETLRIWKMLLASTDGVKAVR